MEKLFKVGDVVADTEMKCVGIVLMDSDPVYGDTRLDSDGMRHTKHLEPYDPVKHKDYHIAPSTKKQIEHGTTK